ncbi:MAG: hypothetical protein DLM57_03705 [Pseudonocardiales bacterium]|nr:MAG: hypothetical protein DLM57_03705 [Pseudonocardiales bacterium]
MTAPVNVSRRPADMDLGNARRTVRALTASALGVLPLCELFRDRGWILDVWLAMLIAVGPAALLRCWQRPRVLHTWLGLALVVIWLTAHYVPEHARGGLLPTTATWHDVSVLMGDVHDTTTNGVAPVHTTLAIKFVLAAMLVLLAALVDLIAVVGRRGALAGVPLLVVYTVSGAVPRHPVSWLFFIGAAAGFLLLLSVDAGDELHGWGRIIPRTGDSRTSSGLSVSGSRIAVIAVIAAVVLPLFAPSRPANLIADALHNGNSSAGGPGGFGTDGGVSLDPFDALKGDLQRTKPVKLFTVTIGGAPAAQPFYVRANVLSNYSDTGWSPGRHGGPESVPSSSFDMTPPASPQDKAVTFTARVHISGLGDNPPVFGHPLSITGLNGDVNWSRDDQLLIGTRVNSGQEFTEEVAQPAPSREQLDSSPANVPVELTSALRVPANMPAFVSSLVGQLTGQLSTQYAKARALTDYFTNPANGYRYSVTTKAGDSGSDLVDFLTHKSGFCQQYAAAMGIMLRIAGVPARVVLGYTHPVPDANGTFTVTTNDAHAWVEAYFTGIGWIPFDPTPLVGIDGGVQADLPWAPHAQPNSPNSRDIPSKSVSGPSIPVPSGSASTGPAAAAAHSGRSSLIWPAVWVLGSLLVVLLALLPAGTRWRRRRGRLRAAGGGDPDPLWAELSDTAVDLGYVWSPARSPRQVAGWLGRQVDAPTAQSLRTLASAVEVARYAPDDRPGATTSLVEELRTVEARLRAERSRAVRIGARLLPASLGWRRFRVAGRRRRR